MRIFCAIIGNTQCDHGFPPRLCSEFIDLGFGEIAEGLRNYRAIFPRGGGHARQGFAVGPRVQHQRHAGGGGGPEQPDFGPMGVALHPAGQKKPPQGGSKAD